MIFSQTFNFHLRPEFQKIKNETKEYQRKLQYSLPNLKFNCRKIPPQSPPPTNARRLRFSDIKVVMALGDSKTAGFAMNDESYVSSVYEYRGRVATCGIDQGVTTLPNYIQQVGQNLKGGSVKWVLPLSNVCQNLGPKDPNIDHLNAAVSCGKANHLKQQIEYLKKQIRNENVNIQNDWKLVNILIGANDLCSCHGRGSQPDVFENLLTEAIEEIRKEFPKTFVSLVSMFETGFSDVYNNSRTSTYCRLVFGVFSGLCPCLMSGKPEDITKMNQLSAEYNKKLERIQNVFNSRNIPDFYVSVQPVLQKIKFEDLSWVSKFDCFHPSYKANQIISTLLFNSLQLPFERKPRSYNAGLQPLCPSENTYLQ